MRIFSSNSFRATHMQAAHIQSVLTRSFTAITFTALSFIPAMAHADINLDISGYFRAYAGYSSQDAKAPSGEKYKNFEFKRKTQLYFSGETTLDNGLTIGYLGTLFQENQDQIDAAKVERSSIYFSGNWGRFNLGRETGAAFILQVSAPSADANVDGYSTSFSFYNSSLRWDYEHASVRDKYADKITYLTPKINGFQAGLSYTPNETTRDNPDDRFGMTQKHSTTFDGIWEVGGRYEGNFSGIGLQAGAGYSNASADDLAKTTGVKDRNIYNIATKITADALGVGAAYLNENAGMDNYNSRTWTLGADYKLNNDYTIGANYFNTKNRISGAKLNRYTVGGSYTFGPGMKFNGVLGLYDASAPQPASADNNDATVIILGTDIRF